MANTNGSPAGHEDPEDIRREFISNIAHDLKTPIAIIKESLSLILDQIPGPINEKQAKVLNMAKDNVNRLTQKIDDLSEKYTT